MEQENIMQEAKKFLDQEKINEATELLMKVSVSDPMRGEAAFLLGSIALKHHKDPALAVKQFQEALSCGNKDFLLYLGYGEAAEALGKEDAARAAYVEAVHHPESDLTVYQRLLRLELKCGNSQAAEIIMDALIAKCGKNFFGVQQKIEYLLAHGRGAEAVLVLENVEGDFKGHPLYWYFRSKALVSSGKPEAALELLNGCENVMQSPSDVVLWNKAKASAYSAAGDTQKAAVLWKKIYQLTKDRSCLLNMAALCWVEEQEEAALTYADILLDNPVMDAVRYQAFCLKINILRKQTPEKALIIARQACGELQESAPTLYRKQYQPLFAELEHQLCKRQAEPDLK